MSDVKFLFSEKREERMADRNASIFSIIKFNLEND